MCAEADPLHCHRTLLVARHLVDRGVPVQHILGDFHLEEHQASMTRLRTMYGLAQQDLLHTDEDLLALALSRQEDRIAYVDRRLQGVLGDAS